MKTTKTKRKASSRSRRMVWILSAAAASLALVNVAAAQYRVGNDGRALDANNRIGSGGVNEGGNRGQAYGSQAYTSGNQIVTGQVTGGAQFRGNVPYSDPFSFRAPTAGLRSDRFIRESAGVPIPGVTGNNNASTVRPFYGQSQTAEAPPGFQLQTPGTGFVPSSRLSRDPGDLRLGRPLESFDIQLPQPGQLILPGPVDPNTQQSTVVTASPLYGVRQWNFEEETDQQFLRGLNDPFARTRLDEGTLDAMRRELSEFTGVGEPGEQQQPLDRIGGGPLDPVDQPSGRPLGAGEDGEQGRAQPLGSEPLGGSVATGQRTYNRMMTQPERVSTQYAELRKRYERFNRLPEHMQDLQAHQQYAQQVRRQQEQQEGAPQDGTATARPGTEGQQQPGGLTTPGSDPTAARPGPGQQGQPPRPGDATAAGPQPGQDPKPPTLEDFGLPDLVKRSREPLGGQTDQTAQGDQPGAQDRPQPLEVTSLATGVQAKGLAEILTEAESLMKQGKYYSALDQYEMADQIAPNNPMVPLGRAIAELGASYYGRADQHLRQAFGNDPALLMARYDLTNLLGQERLEFLVNDLRAIANNEAREARPVFLLSFIFYNIGDERRAAAYLDLAERRAGGSDPLYATMRKQWNLPAGSGAGAAEPPPAEGMNK